MKKFYTNAGWSSSCPSFSVRWKPKHPLYLVTSFSLSRQPSGCAQDKRIDVVWALNCLNRLQWLPGSCSLSHSTHTMSSICSSSGVPLIKFYQSPSLARHKIAHVFKLDSASRIKEKRFPLQTKWNVKCWLLLFGRWLGQTERAGEFFFMSYLDGS